MKLYALVKTFCLGDCLSVGLFRDEDTAQKEMEIQVDDRRKELGEGVYDISVEHCRARVCYDGGCLADYWKIVPCEC